MLSKDEITRIQLEEQLRAEIRNNYTQSPKKNLWFYLNSSFGLWFLSTIAIGLLSYSNAQVNEIIEKNRSINSQISKLDLEIEGRIYQLKTIKSRFDDSLLVYSNAPIMDFPSQLINFWVEFKQAPVYSNYGFHSVYTEFEGRTIVSLIVELSSIVECKVEEEDLKTVIQMIISNKLVPVKVNLSEEDNVLDNIVSKLRLPRWQKNWPDN